MKKDCETEIAVLGAGMMGLEIARKLAGEGFKVTILEGANEIGGLTTSARFGDYVWDKFYHVILPADHLTIRLIKEIGLESELVWRKTKTGFFIDGCFYSMSDIKEFLTFPVLNIFDKFRLGLTILMGSLLNDYSRLETIPISDWLIRWSGKKVFRRIWLPLLKAKLGEEYRFTSAAFICATIKRLYGARKQSSRKEIFGYVRGGYSVILQALGNKIQVEGINLITGFKVSGIREENCKLSIKSTEGVEFHFDHIISTLPSSLTADLCHGLSPESQSRLKSTRYLGVICVSLLIKKPLTPYYVTNITDDGFPFTGIIEMTALVDRKYFGGNSLVYLPKYLGEDDSMFKMPDDEIKQAFLNAMYKIHPGFVKKDIIDIKVARARHVITVPLMEYSKKLPSFKLSVENCFLINSSFITDGTLNVNETLKVIGKHLPKVLNQIRNEK